MCSHHHHFCPASWCWSGQLSGLFHLFGCQSLKYQVRQFSNGIQGQSKGSDSSITFSMYIYIYLSYKIPSLSKIHMIFLNREFIISVPSESVSTDVKHNRCNQISIDENIYKFATDFLKISLIIHKMNCQL